MDQIFIYHENVGGIVVQKMVLVS